MEPDSFHAEMTVAAECAASFLTRSEGRSGAQGPLERTEFALAYVNAIDAGFPGLDLLVSNDEKVDQIQHWNRAETEVDLVARKREAGNIFLVGELKCWDISHQIFDLAKVACLLAGGAEKGFLATIARRGFDFESHPGGELFAPTDGERRSHSFEDLAQRHPRVFRSSFGQGLPEPVKVPPVIDTVAVGYPTPVPAYEGNELRVCLVEVPTAEFSSLGELVAINLRR